MNQIDKNELNLAVQYLRTFSTEGKLTPDCSEHSIKKAMRMLLERYQFLEGYYEGKL